MTPASPGKSTVARAAVILFSACLMGGFVWYSHVKAQPKADEKVSAAQATILPGSKRSNAAIVPDDIRLLTDGTIDLNLSEPAAGQPVAPSNPEGGMILPSSKLGIFRDVVSSPSSAPTVVDGKPAPQAEASAKTPPPPAQPMLFSGSKSLAGPVFSTERIGNVIIIGKGEKENSATQGPLTTTPAAPAPNQDAPIFTSSKSGPIFQKVPQIPSAPAPASKAPPAAKKAAPQTDTPAPASP